MSGARPPLRSTHVADSDAENDDPLGRDRSAASVRSAPVILERPSSRGGAAFDISFEEEQQSTPYVGASLVFAMGRELGEARWPVEHCCFLFSMVHPTPVLTASCRGLPRRLKRLEERGSSGRKKREDMTLEELQAKLQAAEARRKVCVCVVGPCVSRAGGKKRAAVCCLLRESVNACGTRKIFFHVAGH